MNDNWRKLEFGNWYVQEYWSLGKFENLKLAAAAAKSEFLNCGTLEDIELGFQQQKRELRHLDSL